jgi:CysZ protein
MADPSLVPRFERHSRLADFFQGLSLPFTATRLIFRSRKLFMLASISSVVTFASLLALVVALWGGAPQLLAWMWAIPESWYGKALWYVVLGLTFLVLFVVGANTVPLLLLAPLQDPMSEATEELCGGFNSARFSLGSAARQTATSVGHTLSRIGILLLGHAGLFALNLIPGAGNMAWTASAALWTMGWLAAEYLDAPMTRHLYAFRQVRRAVWERLPLCMGFGAAVYVLLWIPVLNFFFIPVAVVAGTLLFRGLRACGTLPEPGPRGA